MEDAFIGTIFMWPLPWAPDGYAFCLGQAIPVNQYQALYSLIGNLYGGNSTNFNLPNLQGRFPLGVGVDVQGITHQLAQKAGSFQSPVINSNNLPLHTHNLSLTATGTASGTVTINGVNSLGDQPYPGGNYISGDVTANATPFISPSAAPMPTLTPLASGTATLGGVTVNMTNSSGTVIPGGGVPTPAPLNVVPPFLAINFIIALKGVYPPKP
jgi:microcystin-dependent protein